MKTWERRLFNWWVVAAVILTLHLGAHSWLDGSARAERLPADRTASGSGEYRLVLSGVHRSSRPAQPADSAQGGAVLDPARGVSVTLDLGQEIVESVAISNTAEVLLSYEWVEIGDGFAPAPATQGGGPDSFGYSYTTSNEGEGARYQWIDATGGVRLALGDDAEIDVALPFTFTYYGAPSTTLRVSNNGAVLFGAGRGNVPYTNVELDQTSLDYLVAPFWDDLDDDAGGVYTRVLGAAPERQFVVEWHDRPHYGSGPDGVTVELILYEGTNNLKFQYQDVDAGNAQIDGGASATVGIRGEAGQFLQVSHNQDALSAGLAICFQYPDAPPCDAVDIPWLAIDPITGTLPAGGEGAIDLSLSAASVNQPGEYVGTLLLFSNTWDAQPAIRYPVTMTVPVPADMGMLEGRVTANRPGGPVPGALVEVSAASGAYSMTTDASGAYSGWLREGTYTVTVQNEGYLAHSERVPVVSGVCTTHSVVLVRTEPVVSVSPPALAVEMEADQLFSVPLTIANSGGSELAFDVFEVSGTDALQVNAGAYPDGSSESELTVDPGVERQMAEQGRADFWVVWDRTADLSSAYGMPWEERGRFVVETLRAAAEKSQAAARAYFARQEVSFDPHWIVNAIRVRGGSVDDLRAAKSWPGVRSIRPVRTLPAPEPAAKEANMKPLSVVTSEEWGVGLIHAPDVWAQYTRGEGIVVANVDTGVRYTHQALVGAYRGNNGEGTFDHDYNWYDPQGATEPTDDHGHGSHTMGTMVGDDGGGNQIGVAPGARWIAADGCDLTGCPDADLISSAEWLLAPCPVGVSPGSGACDPNRRPHVVNNSWGDCATSIDSFFEAQIDAWLASGMLVVFSAGNTGNCSYPAPFCGSLGNPGRHYQVTTVGATTSSDDIASFSLWGPTDDPDPRLSEHADIKPEVSAPGQGIRSAVNTGDAAYSSWNGTSMAAPHVAGTAALVLAANPTLLGQQDLVEDVLKMSAAPKPYSTGCGEGADSVPNNAFGWGRVDALAAVELALSMIDVPWLRVDPVSGTVAISDETTLDVQFSAVGLDPGTYSAALLVRHNDPETNAVSVPVTMTILPEPPDLHLVKTTAVETVEAGTLLTYTLVASNHGGDTTGVVISDVLPAGTLFAWASDGGAQVGNAIHWTGLNLSGGEALTVTLGVTVSCVPSGTEIVNAGAVADASRQPAPASADPVTVTVQREGVSAGFDWSVALADWPILFGNQSERATTYRWDFGDGGDSSARSPAHTYGATGAYTVVLTASNLCTLEVISQTMSVGDYEVAANPMTDRAAAKPGEAAAYTLHLTNTGTLSDTFDVLLTGDWAALADPPSLYLDPGDVGVVTVSVTVPYRTTGGEQDVTGVELVARSDPRVPPAGAELALTTEAEQVYELALSAPSATKWGMPGQWVTHSLRIENLGNVLDSVTFERTLDGWPTLFYPPAMDIAPFGWRTVQVAVAIPLDAELGDGDVMTVRAAGLESIVETVVSSRVVGGVLYLPWVYREWP